MDWNMLIVLLGGMLLGAGGMGLFLRRRPPREQQYARDMAMLADRLEQKILQCRQKAEFLRLRLQQASPEYQLREKKQHAADLEDRLRRTMEQKLIERKHTAALYAERLDGMSPLKKLQQGYSYIEDETGRALTGISQTAPGKMLKIHLADGVVAAKTTAVYASGSDRKESDGREDGR